MSISFYGETAGGAVIVLPIEHPRHLNLSSANARAFLKFLRIEPGQEPSGRITIAEARRAIIWARATFNRRATSVVRPPTDIQRPGRVRVIEGGSDEDYIKMRLEAFERFVAVMRDLGATAICWA